MIDTNTATATTEPRDYCFGGTCATCDGHHGQCTCPCHARAQQQEQMEQQQEPRTLAEILAARTRRVEREQREAAELAQRQREGQRQDDLTAFTVAYEQAFPETLRHALNAAIAYDSSQTSPNGDEGEYGPFATFEHRVPGSASPDADHWTIRIEHYHWSLSGPNAYHADLGYDDQFTPHAAPLLDALNEYPSWLDATITRQHEQAEKAANKAQKANAEQQQRDEGREEQPIYAYVAGDDPGHHGMLHTESKVWLAIATPDTADERLAYERLDRIQAAIVDWDATWLLINLDDDETQQRLIPIARVVSIQPRV